MFRFLDKYKIPLVFVPLGLYWVLLLVLTSLPAENLPDVSLGDKVEHLLAFCVLAVLLKLTLLLQNKSVKVKKRSSLFTIVIVGIYAALDEIHQIFIPSRTGDIVDWIADISGALIAVLLLGLILKYFSSESEFSGS